MLLSSINYRAPTVSSLVHTNFVCCNISAPHWSRNLSDKSHASRLIPDSVCLHCPQSHFVYINTSTRQPSIKTIWGYLNLFFRMHVENERKTRWMERHLWLLGHLNRTEPLMLMLWVTPVLFLPWQVKMPLMKEACWVISAPCLR